MPEHSTGPGLAQFEVHSIVSQSTGEGRVEIRFDGKPIAQMDADKARYIAAAIWEAAEAADTDALIVAFFRNMDMSLEQAAQVLQSLRAFRALKRRETEQNTTVEHDAHDHE